MFMGFRVFYYHDDCRVKVFTGLEFALSLRTSRISSS